MEQLDLHQLKQNNITFWSASKKPLYNGETTTHEHLAEEIKKKPNAALRERANPLGLRPNIN